MIAFLEIITSNLDVTLINIITIVMNLGIIIFMAKDFRIGLIVMMFVNALLFLWSYTQGWDYSIVLPLALVSIGLLSLTIWSNNKYESTGGLV